MKHGSRVAAVAGLLLGAAVAASFRADSTTTPTPLSPRQLQLEGTVASLDADARTFVLATPNGGRVDVRVPIDAPLHTRLRFRQLRTGDFVHIEGRFEPAGPFLLERFLALRRSRP